jgi:hypothetical protein
MIEHKMGARVRAREQEIKCVKQVNYMCRRNNKDKHAHQIGGKPTRQHGELLFGARHVARTQQMTILSLAHNRSIDQWGTADMMCGGDTAV